MVNSWNSESWPFATFEIFVLKCISEKYGFVLQCNDAIHRDYPFKCTIATTRAYRINCTQTGYLLQENFLVGFLDGHFSTRQRMKVCWNVNRRRSFKTPSFVDPIVKNNACNDFISWIFKKLWREYSQIPNKRVLNVELLALVKSRSSTLQSNKRALVY